MRKDVRSLVSRRLLFILVCIIVLVIAIGAYGYRLHADGSGLKGQANDDIDDMMHFTFTWGSETQDIVNGTFKIEISAWFENHTSPWDNTTYEMFYILVSVYDDDYSSDDHLGLVFDENHNGIIDLGFEDRPQLFYADNSTAGYPALTKDGLMVLAQVPEGKSNVCRYDPEKGYVFGPFGGPTSYFASEFVGISTYIPIHICFGDANLYPYSGIHDVSVQFRIYLNS